MKRRTRVAIIVIVAVVALVAAAGWATVSWARGLEEAANAGKDQAQAGAVSLAAEDATAAVSQFQAAAESFTKAQSMLGPDWVEGVAGVIPWAGRQMAAAKTLVAIGIDASTAGAELSAVLQETSVESTATGSSRLSSLLATGRDRIDRALVALGDAAERAAGLSEDGLDPRLAKAVSSLKDALSAVAPFLGRSRSLLALERFLLASPHRLLVISQNSAELRPTGGFAGSFGILKVGPDGFSLEKYSDVYTIPDPPGRNAAPPGATMTPKFGFRDANWWIDFPTSAKAMLGYWRGAGQKPVDGIIAIDVVTVKDLLEVFGPVSVPSYKETFTAANLLDRLLYLVEVKSGGGPQRKGVLVALANELEQRMLSSGPGDLARAGLALAKSADAKHVQMYLTDPGAQDAVTGLGWSGAIAPPAGATDLLVVSNAMNRPGKINIAMRKTIGYEVALASDGSADTTLVLTYANVAPFELPPPQSSAFSDYLRVYRAPGTMLTPGATVPSAGATSGVENGLPIVVRTLWVVRGASDTETIVTRVPGAWAAGPVVALPRAPAAVSGGSSSQGPDGLAHYRLFVVRQADLLDIPTTVTVSSPQGWRIVGATAWKTASGGALNTTVDDRSAGLSLRLDGDLVLDVVMARQ
jgi:hypothetical protein